MLEALGVRWPKDGVIWLFPQAADFRWATVEHVRLIGGVLKDLTPAKERI